MTNFSPKNINNKSIVYMVISLINGKRYIGITSGSIGARWSKHKYDARVKCLNCLLHRAIRKYGVENFKIVLLKKCRNFKNAAKEEIKAIGRLNPEYNLTAGGEGSIGYKHTPEAIKKFSESNMGRPGFWTGKKLPSHVIDLMKVKAKRSDCVASWKRCGLLGSKSISKKIVCLDDGIIHESIMAASRCYGVDNSIIGAVCNKRPHRKTAGGLRFEFYKMEVS